MKKRNPVQRLVKLLQFQSTIYYKTMVDRKSACQMEELKEFYLKIKICSMKSKIIKAPKIEVLMKVYGKNKNK